MATTVRDTLIPMMEAHVGDLYAEYAMRLRGENATIDDLRKGLELIMKANGVGQNEKADTRVVVDIVFENGLPTTHSPITIETRPEVEDAVVKELVSSLPQPEALGGPVDTSQVSTHSLDEFEAMLDELVPTGSLN